MTDSEDYRMVELTEDKLNILKNYAVFVKVRNSNYLEILLGRDNPEEILEKLIK